MVPSNMEDSRVNLQLMLLKQHLRLNLFILFLSMVLTCTYPHVKDYIPKIDLEDVNAASLMALISLPMLIANAIMAAIIFKMMKTATSIIKQSELEQEMRMFQDVCKRYSPELAAELKKGNIMVSYRNLLSFSTLIDKSLTVDIALKQSLLDFSMTIVENLKGMETDLKEKESAEPPAQDQTGVAEPEPQVQARTASGIPETPVASDDTIAPDTKSASSQTAREPPIEIKSVPVGRASQVTTQAPEVNSQSSNVEVSQASLTEQAPKVAAPLPVNVETAASQHTE